MVLEKGGRSKVQSAPDLSYQSQQSNKCSRPVTCERTNKVNK